MEEGTHPLVVDVRDEIGHSCDEREEEEAVKELYRGRGLAWSVCVILEYCSAPSHLLRSSPTHYKSLNSLQTAKRRTPSPPHA
jgi:hypothetical protein